MITGTILFNPKKCGNVGIFLQFIGKPLEKQVGRLARFRLKALKIIDHEQEKTFPSFV